MSHVGLGPCRLLELGRSEASDPTVFDGAASVLALPQLLPVLQALLFGYPRKVVVPLSSHRLGALR